ncbi:MAG: hypothetical protein JST82_14515 [Bacteroidetes bacterium]|nr:hypothetical protein [Bacteroidota bacterium]
MRKLMILLVAVLFSFVVNAQNKTSDVFDANVPITWLGLDFSQLHFIGDAAQWKDAGEITNSQMRDKYFPAWNTLFVNEKDRYKVADAVRRTEVSYAIDVTEKANNSLKGNFFESDGNLYQTLTAEKVAALVKKYDFKGNSGIGMMFIVEGMSKGREMASMWVTFVDMKTKTVLLTKRMEGKSGGFGFRNYWAKTFMNVTKSIKEDWRSWEK